MFFLFLGPFVSKTLNVLKLQLCVSQNVHVMHCTKALTIRGPSYFVTALIIAHRRTYIQGLWADIIKKITRLFSGKSPTVFVLTLTIDSKHTHVDDQAKILPTYVYKLCSSNNVRE